MEDENTQERSLPVIEEELVTGTRAVKTGSVRVRKEVERIDRNVEMPTVRDVVKVSRIPINRPVSSMPAMREEGDTLIVPVVEEEVVIETRLILKEEIHIQRRRVKENVTKAVTLSREHATIERLDGEGRVVETSKPSGVETSPSLFKKRRSLL